MTISDLIIRLEKLRARHGDIPVVRATADAYYYGDDVQKLVSADHAHHITVSDADRRELVNDCILLD